MFEAKLPIITPTLRFGVGLRVSRQMTRVMSPLVALSVPIELALMKIPLGQAAFVDLTGDVPRRWLKHAVGRWALACSLKANWGALSNALTYDSYFVWPGERNATVVRILWAHQRLLVMAHRDDREVVPAIETQWLLPDVLEVRTAVDEAELYDLGGSAAAYAIEVQSLKRQEARCKSP